MDLAEVAPLTVVECPGCGAPQTVFQRFGPFQLERLLGVGGMGAVYKAMDVALQRPIAIKVLQKNLSHDHNLTAQFEREAALTARINHPSVVRVYSTGTAHGMFYIAMELVAQGSLDGLMDSHGAISEAEILRIGIQVAEGLQAANRAGLVHRDIKPGNILFAEQNQPKIVDFGLALQSNQTHSPSGDIWGTPYYVPPESLAFQPEDHRSDMYALGATLWHAFTGSPPHPSTSISIQELLVIKRHPVDLAKAHSSAHPQTVAVLNRMLAFSADERFPDYESLLLEMRAAHAVALGSEASASPKRANGGTARAVGILAAALAILGPTVWWAVHKSPPSSSESASEPSLQTDEARLSHANHLLTDSTKLDATIKRLELISSSPDLTPDLQIWSAISLGTAWALKGDSARQKSTMQSVLSNAQVADESLKKFATGLLSGVDGAPAPQDSIPGRRSIQNLWTSLALLARNHSTEAVSSLKKAAQPASDYNEPGKDLLPLAALILVKLEAFLVLEKEIATESKPEVRTAQIKRAEELAAAPHVSPLLKNQCIALVARAKAASARSLEATQSVKAPAQPQSAPAPRQPEKATQPSPPAQQPAASPPAQVVSSAATEELRSKVFQHTQFFRFKAAQDEAAAFRASNPAEQIEQRRLLRQIGAVENLFLWSIQEINRGGTLPSPIMRNGSAFKSDPVKATDKQLLVQAAPGTPPLPISWAEISPLYLVKLVQFRLSTSPAHPQRAEMLLGAGNIYVALGAKANARPFLEEAAKLNASYADALQGLSPSSSP